MANDRPSLQDQIRRRQQGGFVGRQHQVVEFEDNLRLPPDDPARRFLFSIYGDAGVGKTFLTKRLRQVAAGSGCFTAYLDEQVTDPVSAMWSVAFELGRVGVRMDEFEKRAATYRRQRHAVESDSSAPDGVAAFLTKTAVTIGLAAARDVPVAGSLLAPVDASAAADQAEQARKYLMRKFSDRGDTQLLLSPGDELTPLFVSGLCTAAADRGIALFIDTYERSGLILDDWLRRLYAGQYGSLPESLITTVSGQMPLDPILWADYLAVIADTYLEPFTEAEARLFLRGKGIDDQNTVQVILTLSGRLPLWLATLADAKPTGAAEVGDPAGSVVERYLRWEDDQTRRSLAMAAAFPRMLNQDVVGLLAPDSAQEAFRWLCRLPFVSPKGPYWEYHAVVRSAILRLQLAQTPSEWRANQNSLAAAYQQRTDEYAATSGVTWASRDWTNYVREAMYHRLCADPAGSLQSVLDSAAEAAGHSSVLLRQWVELITDASRDTGDPSLSAIGQQMQGLLRGSEDDLARYFLDPAPGFPEAGPAEPGKSRSEAEARTRERGIPAGGTASRARTRAVPPTTADENSRITVLGATASGKSTFLAALGVALARQDTDWSLAPGNAASADRLVGMTAALTGEGQFPSATTDFEQYEWALNGRYTRVEQKLFRKKEIKEPVGIGLTFIDPPGETLHSNSARTPERSELIEDVTLSDGIVFLLDPVREYRVGDNLQFVHGVLIQLMQKAAYQTAASRGRLPQYAAVCVTKFDDPSVYNFGVARGLVTTAPRDAFKFPRVDDDAETFAREIMDRSTSGGSMLITMFRQYFDPSRIRFFATSAIGFNVNSDSHKFDENDPLNLILDGSGREGVKIRGPIYPINVAEPVIWLSEMLTRARQTSASLQTSATFAGKAGRQFPHGPPRLADARAPLFLARRVSASSASTARLSPAAVTASSISAARARSRRASPRDRCGPTPRSVRAGSLVCPSVVSGRCSAAAAGNVLSETGRARRSIRSA